MEDRFSSGRRSSAEGETYCRSSVVARVAAVLYSEIRGKIPGASGFLCVLVVRTSRRDL